MTAIMLGWNPDHGSPDYPGPWSGQSYAAVVEEITRSGLHAQPWALTGKTEVPVGAEAWLVLQGKHVRGLIGHGVVVRGNPVRPETAVQHGQADVTRMPVMVAFDALLPLGDHIAANVLRAAAPGILWDRINGSGLAVDPADEAGIRSVWTEFGPPAGPNPNQLVPGTYPESAVARVPVNGFERDPDARRACIAHRGTSCAACGFSFEVAYGEIGKDFIDVHHVVPAARLGAGYQLDPLTDLVQLCANCHAMAHYGVSTARTETELRRALTSAGFLGGTVVSPEELEAQRAAHKILGSRGTGSTE